MIQHPENKALKDKVFEVLRDYTHGMGFMEFKFHGFDDIYIEKIDQFKIIQDFQSGYADVIYCAFRLIPEQMIKVVKAYQDLRCSLTFTKAENNTGVILNQYEPIQLEYRVLIENPLDLLKQLNSKEFLKPKEMPDNEQYQPIKVPLAMQLVTTEIYELRHRQLNDNLKEVTAEEVLQYIAAVYEVEMELVPPDNDKVHTHVAFPPMLEFSNAFSWVQERCGVYNYDIGAYFTEKKLLVFPKNENIPREPVVPGTLHIYKVGTDQYPGSDGYTSKIGDDIHAMCTKPIDIKDLSEANAENVGNAQVINRAATALDTKREIIEDGVEQLPEKTITVISPNSNTAVPGIQNAKYITSQDNVHQLMSSMSAQDCAVAEVDLLYLDPFSIYPNHPCTIHYEENAEYKTVNGVVVGCSYDLNVEGRPSKHLYGFHCRLILRLVPDKKEESVT